MQSKTYFIMLMYHQNFLKRPQICLSQSYLRWIGHKPTKGQVLMICNVLLSAYTNVLRISVVWVFLPTVYLETTNSSLHELHEKIDN